MKYIDIGLSAAVCHIRSNPLFNTAVSIGYNNFMEQFENSSNINKTLLARASVDLLKELSSDSFNIKKHIPRELYSRGRTQIRAIPDDFPIFKNTVELCESLINLNKRYYNEWRSSINDCTSSLDYETGEFITSFTKTGGWQVSLSKNDDTLILDFGKNIWGKAQLKMHNTCISPDDLFDGAIICFTELEKVEEGIVIRFLYSGDSQYDVTDSMKKMSKQASQGNNAEKTELGATHELEILCESITSDIRLYSYGEYYRQKGDSYYDLLLSGCESIHEKYLMLGVNFLDAQERRLLPIAKLTCVANVRPHNNKGFSSRNYDRIKLFSFLDNHFEVDRLINELRDIYNFPELSSALNEVAKAYDDDCEKAYKKFSKVINCYRLMSDQSNGYFFLRKFCNLLYKAGSGHEYMQGLSYESEDMKKIFSPSLELLSKNGFNGQFPHYKRNSRKSYDFLSFTRHDGTINGMSAVSYSINIASISRSDFELTLLDPDDANVNDILSLPKSKKHYTQIMNEYDGMTLVLSSDRSVLNDIYAEEKSKRLLLCIRAAINAFSGEYLGDEYLAARVNAYRKNGLRTKDILQSGFFALCIVCMLYTLFLFVGFKIDLIMIGILLAVAAIGYLISRLLLWQRRMIRLL